MILDVAGEIIHWRGPSPFHFVVVPDEPSAAIELVAPIVSYGWGCIPVTVTLGGTRFTTSLFPKDGGYLVPIKAAVRTAERVALGDHVTLRLELDV
jgi:hypothetical protein